MTPGRIVALITALLLAGLGFVNYAINAETQVNLLFKVPLVGAWTLAEGISLPILLAIAVGIGLVISALVFGIKLASTSRRLRNLRRQNAALEEELDYNRRTAKESRSVSKTATSASPLSPAASAQESSQFDDLI